MNISKADKKNSKRASPYNKWTDEAYKRFRDYQIEYYKENYRSFTIKYKRGKDDDVINFLESLDNISEWVRKMVRKEIDNNNKSKNE